MIRPLEVPQFEVQSQNDVRKMGPREKIVFFKSLFQKFLEIICIKVQLVKYSQWTKDSGSILIVMIRPLEVPKVDVQSQNNV